MPVARFRDFQHVSTHSRLKAAGLGSTGGCFNIFVSTHSRLKAAGIPRRSSGFEAVVSTHSRLKAAGTVEALEKIKIECFNTQPPEGGWDDQLGSYEEIAAFQHTAA